MPFVSVHIHFVWSTKNWLPLLKTEEIRTKMWQHIRDNGIKKSAKNHITAY